MTGARGRGSNLRALHEHGLVGRVVVPADGTPAGEWAASVGLPVVIVEPGDVAGLLQETASAPLLVLAGYTRLLPAEVALATPTINVHPSLLPRHGGPGMWGRRVHEAVLAAGDAESGCTVHRVTPVYDEGEILLQLRCPVHPGDDADTLAARVLALEHRALPEVAGRLLG